MLTEAVDSLFEGTYLSYKLPISPSTLGFFGCFFFFLNFVPDSQSHLKTGF